ncbi:PaaD-like protein (DUF59) involved in Fe-S cluster assembly [Hyphomicrobium sulfonivorans]|uniref:PaaD-like protein (DUF59) involved in Fe-S cluster assembly n=2 Tax=Hyphomicrobium TaxID=81 RepID=A0A120CX69_HYPSL|nr:PaaD-like protein (DUF59) involved in Fe-S cluster assembly [Hyphomicrobium sulfonivorans]
MDDGKPGASKIEAEQQELSVASTEQDVVAAPVEQTAEAAPGPVAHAPETENAGGTDVAAEADAAAAAYISESKPRRAPALMSETSGSDFRGATTPDGILSTDSDDPFLRDIIAALKTVYDPEIPADIYELGLIYAVDVDDDRNVVVTMTLTAPGCPVAGEMPKWVENAVNAVPGVANTSVTMTFDPPWDMGRMSDEARLALNMF